MTSRKPPAVNIILLSRQEEGKVQLTSISAPKQIHPYEHHVGKDNIVLLLWLTVQLPHDTSASIWPRRRKLTCLCSRSSEQAHKPSLLAVGQNCFFRINDISLSTFLFKRAFASQIVIYLWKTKTFTSILTQVQLLAGFAQN